MADRAGRKAKRGGKAAVTSPGVGIVHGGDRYGRAVQHGAAKRRVLVICAHLHEDRTAKADKDDLQPMAGLHIASLIDRADYDVELYHEMWHGPFDTAALLPGRYGLVFISGLQMDFDRMRQLSYFFRRAGAVVVAGGSICTLFPEFAARFFDAICAGGVECTRDVVHDFEAGRLQKIYRRPAQQIGDYELDYALLEKSGISLPVHYIEASRGCNFTCDFCVIPAEGARHARYGLANIAKNLNNTIESSPRFSMRRLFPIVWFIDNNFSNNLTHMREVCRLMREDKRVKLWGALVTQNVIVDRELVKLLAESKCAKLFTGIESFDEGFVENHGKTQNLKRANTLLEDIAYAQSLGIVVIYGYLFDPRTTRVAEMENQVQRLLTSKVLNHPYFFAFVAPLAGTKLFWEAVDAGELLPNLRLRDLDGRCVAYRNARDDHATIGAFASRIFGAPGALLDRRKLVLDILAYTARWAWRRPVTAYLFFHNRIRLFRMGSNHSRRRARTYIGGTEILDPQYKCYPPDVSAADKARYFEPIMVTDGEGRASAWLEAYRPAWAQRGTARERRRASA
jgi:hypothetical protein